MSAFFHRTPELWSVNAGFANRLPEPFAEPAPQPDFDDEDTQPSLVLPDADDDFCDAPTIPGFMLRADGSVVRELDAREDEMLGEWDRALRAVAVAVKRVFASHSIKRLS